MSAKKGIYGWHILPYNGRLAHGDGRYVLEGQTLTVEPPVTPCEHGLHMCPHLMDAFGYLPSTPGKITYVRLEADGDNAFQDDKWVGEKRTCLVILPDEETARLLFRAAYRIAVSLGYTPVSGDERTMLEVVNRVFNDSFVDFDRNGVPTDRVVYNMVVGSRTSPNTFACVVSLMEQYVLSHSESGVRRQPVTEFYWLMMTFSRDVVADYALYKKVSEIVEEEANVALYRLGWENERFCFEG